MPPDRKFVIQVCWTSAGSDRPDARVSHAKIASVHNRTRHKRWLAMLMKSVCSRTLAESIRGGPVSETEAVHASIVNACELDHAPGKGVIHRESCGCHTSGNTDRASAIHIQRRSVKSDNDQAERGRDASRASAETVPGDRMKLAATSGRVPGVPVGQCC